MKYKLYKIYYYRYCYGEGCHLTYNYDNMLEFVQAIEKEYSSHIIRIEICNMNVKPLETM